MGASVECAGASRLRRGICPFLDGCFRGVSALELLSCPCTFEHIPTARNKASGSVACVISSLPFGLWRRTPGERVGAPTASMQVDRSGKNHNGHTARAHRH